jgi:hypothetical protein
MMQVNINELRQAVQAFDESIAFLTKQAFAPAPPPQGPMTAPPADPNAMPPQDPNAMPPGDPNAMPPADPNAMPPGDPNAAPPQEGGAMPPELEQILNDMAGGVTQVAQTVEQQQSSIEQLGSRQLEIEKKLQELMQSLNGPAPFEGSTKDPAALEAEAGAEPTPAGAGQELPLA